MKQFVLLVLSLFTYNLNAMNPDFEKMVEYATKAPSGHNTQPWIFLLTEKTIEIQPNFQKSLPVVDSDNRELYISLGCAAENLVIAAKELGYSAQLKIGINKENQTTILVDFEKNDPPKDSLFLQITRRQTNRSVYNGRQINPDTIKQLQQQKPIDGITIRFYEKESPEFDICKKYVLKGNVIQMSSNDFKEELLSWIRFNKKQTNKQQDGLTYAVMGAPSTPQFLGKPIVKSYLKPDKQNKVDLDKISSSSHLVLFTSKQNNPQSWINTGRSLQRFLLLSTHYGIANAYLNQPCEVPHLSSELMTDLNANNEFATLLLRIGFANPSPYSPRKDVSEVIRY